MSTLDIISGFVGLYALIIFLGDRQKGATPISTSSSILPGSPSTFDLGNGLHTTLTPDVGNGIPFVNEFERRDPQFKQRLRKATIDRMHTIGVGKQYPYKTGNIVHDIGFPYMGAPLSYVAYPQGTNPSQTGTWKPIEV